MTAESRTFTSLREALTAVSSIRKERMSADRKSSYDSVMRRRIGPGRESPQGTQKVHVTDFAFHFPTIVQLTETSTTNPPVQPVIIPLDISFPANLLSISVL